MKTDYVRCRVAVPIGQCQLLVLFPDNRESLPLPITEAQKVIEFIRDCDGHDCNVQTGGISELTRFTAENVTSCHKRWLELAPKKVSLLRPGSFQATPEKIARPLDLSEQECRQLILRYVEAHPALANWMIEMGEQLVRDSWRAKPSNEEVTHGAS